MPKTRQKCKHWLLLGFLALSLGACDPFLYGGRLGRSTNTNSGLDPEAVTKTTAMAEPAPLSPSAEKLADLSSRIDGLQARLQRLEGQVEENRYHLRQLQEAQVRKPEKQPELVAKVDKEPPAKEEPAEAQESPSAAPVPTPSAAPPVAPVAPQTPTAKPPALATAPLPPKAAQGQAATASPEETKVFKEGMELFRKKSYKAARQKFNRYLSDHPNGAKAVEARYFLADTFYQERQLDEAIVEFNKVVDQYPKSVLAPPALLKQALAFQAQGKTKVYNLILEKIVADYPQSAAAQQARNLMGSGTSLATSPPNTAKGN
ncbi:MAG: tol-pal system protein YbgF [Deltaproteobacteria bacterium]|nr:tol-pal system protein YbgF [Deltaproteobacteria bacterium]MBW2134826.1 tol-pal system protein YbgF [Deltaproteobacteria bacterium]